MKVIYHSFSHKHKSEIISSLHSKYNWEPVCIAGSPIDADGTIGGVDLDNCIISNPFKLRRAEFDYDDITPPIQVDASILESLSAYEGIFLDLLGTFQDNTGWEFSYGERKNFYIDILTYWNTVINLTGPDLIVFYTWPHTPSCYPLYLIAKHYYKIDILFIDPAPLLGLDYHVISNSIENLSNFYNNSIQDNNYINSTNENDSLLVNENDSLLVNDMANDNLEPDHIIGEYDTFKHSKPILSRFYNYLEGKINLVNIFKSYRHFQNLNFDRKANRKPYFMSNSRMNLLEKFIFFEKLKFKNKSLKKYYNSKIEVPDLNNTYIYFSAPYQPEATSYLGGHHYENIILTLRVLSYACPKGWVIYYKEHPSIFFDNFRGSLKRNNKFYDQICNLQNIKMVASNYDQFALMENSKAVALICGSTAWQAVLRGKPVISFGQSWYSSCKGIIQVSSLQDVKDTLDLIISGYTPERKDVNHYVSVIKKVAFKFKEHYYPPFIVYDKVRAEEIADEFYKAFIRSK